MHLAREFGFCYGVDRAVDYAYQARKRFPDQRVFLTGEIIHNPHVNDQLRAQGIRFLSDPGEPIERARPRRRRDPAGVRRHRSRARSSSTRRGCTLVDTTCGSVLNVWKNVKRYAQDGLHLGHPRQVLARGDAGDRLAGGANNGGHYLVVLDRAEARVRVRLHPRRRRSAARSCAAFRDAASPGFDPDRHLAAHRLREPDDDAQLRVARDRRDVPRRRCATATATPSSPQRFRAFDTICSATQDRQDAVIALLDEHALDLMVVIGGYNSSNTCNLARICAAHVPTFHIADPDGLVSADAIRHRDVESKTE